jgi:hypothetical protein
MICDGFFIFRKNSFMLSYANPNYLKNLRKTLMEKDHRIRSIFSNSSRMIQAVKNLTVKTTSRNQRTPAARRKIQPIQARTRQAVEGAPEANRVGLKPQSNCLKLISQKTATLVEKM